jgi:transcriptional regulator with XRE-family HTH domain
MNAPEARNALRLAIGAWFRNKREAHGVGIPEAAAALGITISGVSNLELQGMSYKTALKHANTLGWSVPNLEEILNNPEASTTTITLTSLQPSAGTGMSTDNEIITRLDLPIDWMRRQYPQIANLNNLALCTARGSSMEPAIRDSDTLVADTTHNSFDSDDVYVFTYDDELFIKRIQRIPGEGVLMTSDNKELYAPIALGKEQLKNVTVHAKIVGKWGFQHI